MDMACNVSLVVAKRLSNNITLSGGRVKVFYYITNEVFFSDKWACHVGIASVNLGLHCYTGCVTNVLDIHIVLYCNISLYCDI